MTTPKPNRPAPDLALDHLVLAATSLEAGNDYVLKKFGVRPEAGGRHEGWGTHNSLLQIGSGTYLEVIAPDPEQPAPNRPRPFGMDVPALHERIAVRPRLVHYMLRTNEIDAAGKLIGFDYGAVQNMSRDDLRWQLTVRTMRGTAEDSLLPSLINWGQHPSPGRTLPSRGTVLTALHLRGPAQFCNKLSALKADRRLLISERSSAMLAAEFQTPKGWAILD